MYTNISNIIDTVINLMEANSLQINRLVQEYQPSRNLCVFKGMRNTLPVDAYPSLELEPTTGSNEWATTRAQRPRYEVECTLTTRTDNEAKHVEYIGTLATMLVAILTSPENLQMTVVGSTRWDVNAGLVPTVILDSLVDSVTYNAVHDGTVRTATFNWFAVIHEPFPDAKFRIGLADVPTVILPHAA